MIINRRFEKEFIKDLLEDYTDNVETQGYGFIEVRMTESGETTEEIIGLDEAKVNMIRKPGSRVTMASGVTIIKDGHYRFYPDKNWIRYGYILDTERNRRWLAAELKRGKYQAADRRVDEEIKELARDLGMPTFPMAARDTALDNYLHDTGKNKTDKVALEMRIKELEEQLKSKKVSVEESSVEDLEETIEKLEKKIEDKAKPLSGVKIDKNKKKK